MTLWIRYKTWVDSLTKGRKLTLMFGVWIAAAAIMLVYVRWDETRPVPVPEALSYRLETEHLIIHTDLPEPEAKHYATFFEGFYGHFSAEYFRLDQEDRLVMLLFGDPDTYAHFCTEIGFTDSPFGFYMGSKKNTIVVNLRKGLGTAAHELVHHFLSLGGIDHHPDWINEGIPTFFEKFMGHIDDRGQLHVSFGYYSNWRFPITKAFIDDLSLADLFITDDQCIARSFTLFLHEQGKLKSFVKQLHQAGTDAVPATVVEEVLGRPLAEIEKEWKDWVNNQPIDAQVDLVPASFIKTQDEWNAWWEDNRKRITWEESRGIYVVKEEYRSQQDADAKRE